MTGPTYTIPSELLTGLQNNDERFFEQGFRVLFPILVQETAKEFDDPSAVIRVVEQAFVRIWDERAAIRSIDAVNVAMRTALREGVARARSRRAALDRFERHEHVTHTSPRDASALDLDQSWMQVQRGLHPAEQVSAAVHVERGVEAKHRAAAHMTEAMGRRTKWKGTAAVALGVAVVSAGIYGLWRMERRSGDGEVLRALAAEEAQVLTANNGLIGKVTMADETIVKLGSGSRLRVSEEFGASLRAVSLNGTASFAVASAEMPFELRANGVALSLPTGKVDVRADSLAPTLVRVSDGQVRVKVGDSSWTAAAGESFVVETSGTIHVPTSVEMDEALGWLDGRFAASGSVGDVVAKVNRWYGANLGIGDASIADRPASAAGSLDSLRATIKSLEKSSKVQMVWEKQRMMLFPTGR